MMSFTPPPIKGAGQYLRIFERNIKYISESDVEPDDDGYVRGNRVNEYDLKAAVVPNTEEEIQKLDYGDTFNGFVNVYVRTIEQEKEDISFTSGGYFVIDDEEWRILNVDNYGTVIKMLCGKSLVGGYPVE